MKWGGEGTSERESRLSWRGGDEMEIKDERQQTDSLTSESSGMSSQLQTIVQMEPLATVPSKGFLSNNPFSV